MMKKIISSIAVLMGVFALVSCGGGEKQDNQNPSGDLKFTSYDADQTIYYGQKLGAGLGYYEVAFTGDNGETLVLSCLGNRSLNALSAKLPNGEYVVAEGTELNKFTFFPTAPAEGTVGSTFTKDGKTKAVDGGSFKVLLQTGSYTITFDLRAGDETIKGTYTGSIKFKNKDSRPPKVENHVAASYASIYYGRYTDPTAPSGYFLLTLGAEGTDLNTMNDAYVTTIYGYMDLAEDNNNVSLPSGTYKVDPTATIDDPFTLMPGMISNNAPIGTCEFSTGTAATITDIWVVSEGTMTVKNENGKYEITANLKGRYATAMGVEEGAELEECNWTYSGEIVPMNNMADPAASTKMEDKTDLVLNDAFVQVSGNKSGDGNKIWFYNMVSEGLTLTLNGQQFDIDGTGTWIQTMLWGPAPASGDLPEGTYEMSRAFNDDYVEDGKNYVMPGNNFLIPNDTQITGQDGTWYFYVSPSPNGGLSLSPFAGVVSGKGKCVATNNNGTHRLEFEFYDRNGHVISGYYEGVPEVVKVQ